MALSAEAILISALLNNQEVSALRTYGVSPRHFVGYQSHVNWLLNYVDVYQTEPSKEAFIQAFPDFVFADHHDIRSAVDMVYKAVNKRRMNEAMTEAVNHMGVGDVTMAYKTLNITPLSTAPKPKNLLTDTSFLDNWDEQHSFVEVPYPTLQKHTGGIRPGNLWYVASRPNQGKSAHLCNMATKALLDGCRVMFYSLEMSEMEVRFRFHAKLAKHYGYKGINLTDLRDRRVDAHDYKQFVSELDDRLGATGGHLHIHTPADGMLTPSVIASRADEYHLNVVDYIGLMKSDQGAAAVSDWRVAAGISNDLKLTAGASTSSFLVASQINREGEAGQSPPKISQLAQSDALGQDGDVVVTFRSKPKDVATHFMIDKNRHGPRGIEFFTTFDPNYGVFDEIDREKMDRLVEDAEAAI